MTEKYVIFSLALLYAGLCPLGSVVVAAFFLCDSVFEMYMDSNVMQRNLPAHSSQALYWNQFGEAIAILSVITNSFLLFQYSTTFEETLKGYVAEDRVFYIVVAIEHFVIILLVAIKYLIPDMPNYIKKSNNRTKNEIKTLHNVDLVDSVRVEQLKKQVDDLKKQMLSMSAKKPTESSSALQIIQYH